jgi:hypothetical protein
VTTPRPALEAALAAASSPDWATRARAGRDLARWADDPRTADALTQLLLDQHDTFVTDETSRALLERRDTDGLRLVAHAIALADEQALDHLWDTVEEHALIDTSAAAFVALCRQLRQDPAPTVRAGTRALLDRIEPYTTGPDRHPNNHTNHTNV